MIDGRELYHIYRGDGVETVALRGAAIHLEPGEWTSLVGPSGSGKSTLIHVLAGMVEPSGGSVMIDGMDITRLPPRERARWRRRNVGIVLQRDNLHPLLDVAGNVALPLRLDGRGSGEIRSRVDELVGRIGLAGRRRHRVGQLSGGEAQRVAVAVAVATKPRLLLTDEPTGELDDQTAVAVLELFSEIRDGGAAVLTVTHDRSIAARADRRLAMLDGQVVDVA